MDSAVTCLRLSEYDEKQITLQVICVQSMRQKSSHRSGHRQTGFRNRTGGEKYKKQCLESYEESRNASNHCYAMHFSMCASSIFVLYPEQVLDGQVAGFRTVTAVA